MPQPSFIRAYELRQKLPVPGNTQWKGRLSRTDLIIKVAYFVKMEK
jgi:hypothetical protein